MAASRAPSRRRILLAILVGMTASILAGSSFAQSQVPSVTLQWTAPGDDGTVGTADSLAMRWSATRPDTTSQASFDTWWTQATTVAGLPRPALSGTLQSHTVPGPFTVGQRYYFVMRAWDEVRNRSPYSNVAEFFPVDIVAPSRITDLRVR